MINVLGDHFHQWRSCGRCSAYCHTKAFYRGNDTCKYLFVADAPMISEGVTGLPFTGVVGKMFIDLLSQSGCVDYGFTYLIACTPSGAKERTPTKDEIESCKERLDELIEIVTPNYYISLGALAKKHPPSGIEYHLNLDCPNKIFNQSPNRHKVVFNRNKNKLKGFIKDHG